MKTDELITYIKKARKEGKSDDAIRDNLLLAGWSEKLAEAGLRADLDANDAPKPPDTPGDTASPGRSKEPIAVMQTFSQRGFEYIIMFIALGVSAFSLGAVLHDLATMTIASQSLSSGPAFSPLSTAGLIVALPIFAFLFLRLKRAERADPKLHFDTSRRRAVQLTLVVSFVVGVWQLIYYLYQLLDGGNSYDRYSNSTSSSDTALLNVVHALITLVIAGGIFAYYWVDLQRKEGK